MPCFERVPCLEKNHSSNNAPPVGVGRDLLQPDGARRAQSRHWRTSACASPRPHRARARRRPRSPPLHCTARASAQMAIRVRIQFDDMHSEGRQRQSRRAHMLGGPRRGCWESRASTSALSSRPSTAHGHMAARWAHKWWSEMASLDAAVGVTTCGPMVTWRPDGPTSGGPRWRLSR